MKTRSFILLATAAATLGLVAPVVKAGEFSLSFKEGSVEIFYHLGQNPTAEEFQNGKTKLMKLVRDYSTGGQVAIPSNNCDKPGKARCQPLWGDQTGAPISFPGVE